MHKRLLTALALITLSTALLIGCGNKQKETTKAENTTETVETTTTEESTTTQETEEPHSHNYIEEITTQASCETDGLKTFTCDCGDTYTETISATGHIFENYSSNNDATYTADGTETAKCNTCELTDTRTVDGSKLEYTYTDMTATMYATQTVNIRNLPSTDGEKIGSLSTNQEIVIKAQCNETSWYMFDYNGQTAFVSNNYVSTEKVEVAPPAQETATTTNSNEAFPYELYVMYYDNMGYPYFYYIGLNKLYISPEDDAKSIACAEAQSEYVFEHFQGTDNSCLINKYWGPVGNYKRGNDPIYVMYIYECKKVILPPPEERGIFTAGLYWPDHLF